MAEPIALLLVPRTVERFILYDQGQDLLRAPGVVAVEAPRIPYGLLGRLPAGFAAGLARGQARRLRVAGEPRVAMMFHPFQFPFAAALLARWPECELWYGLFDLTTHAPDAGPRTRRKLEHWHRLAAERSALTFAVSSTLVERERAEGRDALLMPSAADSFPALDPTGPIAVAFGNLGRRTDWALLRAIAERMPDLVVLMVGAVDEKTVRDARDYAACRALANFVWLGRRSNEEAARLILCADVGLLPMPVDDFNDAGLPNRILKAARQGRRTITPAFDGVRVWERAVVRVDDVDGWVAALRDHSGARTQPDVELRDWALRQTGEHQNAPLWRRLRELGIALPPLEQATLEGEWRPAGDWPQARV
jgi:hypothetical protein